MKPSPPLPMAVGLADPALSRLDRTSASDAAELAGRKIVGRLKLYFAILASLGGAILAAGADNDVLPVIAIFFAIFGYLFVDWMRLFALPPIAGYALMAIVAVFCVSDFTDIDQGGNHQMMSVAQLLVAVQSILMLQEKTRRIFEQLAVFCLLELVVAAVFNNALSFGMLLIPISLVAAFALTLLATLHATDGLTGRSLIDGENPDQHLHPSESLAEATDPPSESATRSGTTVKSGGTDLGVPGPVVSIQSATSLGSLGAAHRRLPRMTFLALAPAVLLIGVIFFYALPRTTDAATGGGGAAMVGFSEEVSLDQIGQMNSNPKVALRVRMTDKRDGSVYRATGPVYLRGKVLERYRAVIGPTRNTARWSSPSMPMGPRPGPLPAEFSPKRASDRNFFDPVEVQVTAETGRTPALFAVAPYHRIDRTERIVHVPNRNTLKHSNVDRDFFPRTSYRFGTHGFRSSEQTPWIALGDDWTLFGKRFESRLGNPASSRHRLSAYQRAQEDYISQLLEFDREAMPSVVELARRFELRPSGERRTAYQFAKALELYFASSGDFGYTLKLDRPSLKRTDPIEQFVATDRQGHCQYFASALAMTLRAANIPTRLVVGYSTEEFNSLSEQYIARGSHAHSWVEALIDRDQIPDSTHVYGQPEADQYWLRLDPTPGIRAQVNADAGGVGQVLDLAQNIWDDYVVDMDGQRQSDALLGGGTNPMHQSYNRLVARISLAINRIRAGELGGGSLADGGFSGVAAIMTVLLALVGVVAFRFRPSRRGRGQRDGEDPKAPQPARMNFYHETLEQLARVGVYRRTSQTPAELTRDVSDTWHHPQAPTPDGPLAILTSAYYRLRFGSQAAEDPAVRTPEIDVAYQSLKDTIDLAQSGPETP